MTPWMKLTAVAASRDLIGFASIHFVNLSMESILARFEWSNHVKAPNIKRPGQMIFLIRKRAYAIDLHNTDTPYNDQQYL